MSSITVKFKSRYIKSESLKRVEEFVDNTMGGKLLSLTFEEEE